jgi:hypothetical protein
MWLLCIEKEWPRNSRLKGRDDLKGDQRRFTDFFKLGVRPVSPHPPFLSFWFCDECCQNGSCAEL